ncbi:Nitrilotriacetate monooxygenase component B [hydrothermal vent metagenome]|uniref:Nitrilotriacetate monooxygenase component B n=1 Tax=hydrothermal vent metagenome TaxID=652676 RepID=A0A3B0UIZ7_9ZZZZ
MIINPAKLNDTNRYKLITGSIVPRPIAWVSTMDKAGTLNLAPFSYFTAVSTNPMTLLFCPGWSSLRGRMKDTLYNVRAVGEFVINIVDESTKEGMNLSATEFEWAGVTAAASQAIQVPRVAEAPIAFECTLQQIVVVNEGPGGGAAVFGEVKSIYVRDGLLENGRIPPEKLQPIGRLAGSSYAHLNDLFTMNRLPPPE